MGSGINGVTASTGKDDFQVGYAYSGTSTLTASAAATDVIWGWDDQSLSRDSLTVALGSTAVIGALLGQTNWSDRTQWSGATGWSGDDTVDLRQQVTNNGLIQIAAGSGNNTVYGSSGSDRYMVGYVNLANGGTTTASVPAAVDMIYGWDAQAWSNLPLAGTWDSTTHWNGQVDNSDTVYDRLEVAQGSTARIGSLAVDSATDAQRWDGVEIIDLRSNVINHNAVASDGGAIEIWAGPGNDYVYGSAGRDLIYGGPGLDNLWGGMAMTCSMSATRLRGRRPALMLPSRGFGIGKTPMAPVPLRAVRTAPATDCALPAAALPSSKAFGAWSRPIPTVGMAMTSLICVGT